MSALFTALYEGESKESLAEMVCQLRSDLSKANTKIEQLIEQLHAATEDYANAKAGK